ncbi:AsmA family protein [Sneathiella aquimaris]|uniref:AsmA family protein n=1 Tax=Sneathiella aquimaris TaxID=2599305 RepID=UPI00146D2B8B|nr:AsmA family protein [Sneathiella aquimaris]
MGKIITGAVAGLVVLLAVLVAVFYFNLDKVIITAVEEVGPDVTQTDVTLNEVDLDLTSGKGALRGLSVGNPKGFEEPNAFMLNEISVAVDLSGSNDKVIHIEEILVTGPQITYELSETGNNLDVLQKNIDDYIKANSGAKDTSTDPGSEEDGPKLIIDKLVIKDGRVTVKAPITMNQKIEGKLPTIQLTDIGKDSGGASPAEVAAQVADKITDSALSVVSDLGIGKTLDGLKNSLSGATDAVSSGAGKAAEGAGKAVEGATGAVKSLFK